MCHLITKHVGLYIMCVVYVWRFLCVCNWGGVEMHKKGGFP